MLYEYNILKLISIMLMSVDMRQDYKSPNVV